MRIDYPGATSTILTGGNSSGTLIGAFFGADGPLHGFVLEQGEFVDLGANLIPRGINESGTIVGAGDQGAFFMWRRKQ